MQTHTLPDPTSGRHYGMDWLRIGAFALLILYHTGMGFVPWDWHVKWHETPSWVRYPMLATNGWRLSLLFLVSGFASAALLTKVGRGAYLRSRTARLWIPLFFGVIVIVPVQPWIELQFKHGYAQSFAHFWLHDYFRFGTLEGIALPTWQHLWFVAYLIAYTLLSALLAVLVPPRAVDALGGGGARLAGPPDRAESDNQRARGLQEVSAGQACRVERSLGIGVPACVSRSHAFTASA